MKWILLLGFVVVLIGVLLVKRNKNNVCKTFGDYYSNRDTNKNCYYNPDGDLELPDIAKRHGYPLETHVTVTRDGYILTVFRIPHGRNGRTEPGKPIFIQHGFSFNSGLFVTTGKKSLGFILADAGYDVWIGNFRGTRYSRNHTHLSTTDSKFWDFSMHELGVYDVPAQLAIVTQITGKKVAYMGYSMGGAAGYIYATTFPELAQEKIEILIVFAPSVFMGNNHTAAKYVSYIWASLERPVQMLTNGEILTRPPLPQAVFEYFCFPLPIQMQICQIFDMVTLGFSYSQNDPETLPVTLKFTRDACSVKALSHLSQLVASGNFQKFDHGPEGNMKLYGTTKPSHYNLSKSFVPSYIIYAPNDKLISKQNIEDLYRALPQETRRGIYVVPDESFNHLDMFTGKDVVQLLYKPLVEFLNDKLK